MHYIHFYSWIDIGCVTRKVLKGTPCPAVDIHSKTIIQ